MSSPTGSGFSNWPRSPIRRRCPTRWRRCWASPNNRARVSASRWPPRWRAGCGCWCWTTASMCVDAVADLVEAILAHSATVRILATSREGLGVGDEQLWPVPSLDVDAGTDSAAVSLFVERAHSVAPRLLDGRADEAAAVVEICRRLDGIPLAIELAASRMASMTASEVRDRLDQRFRLLVGSRRGLATPPDTAPRGGLVLRPARRRRRRRCWSGVRCSQADLTSKVRAQ